MGGGYWRAMWPGGQGDGMASGVLHWLTGCFTLVSELLCWLVGCYAG